MSKELVTKQSSAITVDESEWTPQQVELIKKTICKGATDDQLKLFGYVCRKTALDPFMKQIYGIVRNTKDGPTMTIQTSIDGLRLIADRTGNYLPGKKPTYTYTKEGSLYSATSYIKKWARGEWHEIEAEAVVSEYKPKYANDFWENKTNIMISKCAEALALRKAFPAEMSGVYIKEELDQTTIDVEESSYNVKPAEKAISKKKEKVEVDLSFDQKSMKNSSHSTDSAKYIDVKPLDIEPPKAPIVSITTEQVVELSSILNECDPAYYKKVLDFYHKACGIETLDDLPLTRYEEVLASAMKNREAYKASLKQEEPKEELEF